MRSGKIFNQKAICQYITPRRFDKRYRDPNQIALEDLRLLGGRVCIKDFEKSYGHKEFGDYYLFLDEKPVGDSFILLGVLVEQDGMAKIDEFVKRYKRSLDPKLSPDDWYIKGDGKHLYKYNVFNVKVENFYLARRRWKILGDMLESFDVNHSFHISAVDTKSYMKDSKTKADRKVAKKQIESDALINILKSLEIFRFDTLTIVIDNIDDTMKANYQDTINEFFDRSELVSLQVQSKDDFVSLKSGMLQYVDTFLYAVSRFMFPNNRKGKYNILVDFELFRYEDFFGSVSPFEQEMMIEVFESIKNIYQHVRFHIIDEVEVGISATDEDTHVISSVVYRKDGVDYNIGSYLYQKITLFCTIRTDKRIMSSEVYCNVGVNIFK